MTQELSAVNTAPAGAFAPALRALYGVAALAGAAIGLFSPLVATLMSRQGASEVLIGANSTVFFLCVMLAAPLAGRLVRLRSARFALMLGLLLTACVAMAFPWFSSVPLWFALRAVMGIGVGLYMISGQTALNHHADERQRALVSGMYALAFGIGMGAGPVLGAALFEVSPSLAFAAGSLILLMGIPMVWSGLPTQSTRLEPARTGLLARLSIPLHAVFAYGVTEATLMSLYPILLLQRGYSVMMMSLAFSAFVLGALVSTVPLSHLADRIGRERVLLACAGVGIAATTGLVLTLHPLLSTLLSLLVGASLGPVFAIALALVGERLTREELPGGSALFTTAFSLGAMLAPLLSALIMRELGAVHIFSLGIVLFVSLLLRLLLQGGVPRVVPT